MTAAGLAGAAAPPVMCAHSPPEPGCRWCAEVGVRWQGGDLGTARPLTLRDAVAERCEAARAAWDALDAAIVHLGIADRGWAAWAAGAYAELLAGRAAYQQEMEARDAAPCAPGSEG